MFFGSGWKRTIGNLPKEGSLYLNKENNHRSCTDSISAGSGSKGKKKRVGVREKVS